MGPAGFVAVIAGWVTTEVGRQPWVIYGLLRTARRRLADRRARRSTGSLIAFVIVYFAVFGAGTWYILRLMAPRRRQPGETGAAPTRRSARAGITPAPASSAAGAARREE